MTDIAPSPIIHLLVDNPAKEDSFSGGHQKVAEAIAQVINNASPGKIIGLIGGWGSGKSTVIKFLQDKLSDKNSFRGLKNQVFIFDAWRHQQDPIRRAFLENLIYTFHLENKFKDTLLYIKKSKEQSEITSSPKFGFIQKSIATILLMVIVASSLIAWSRSIAIFLFDVLNTGSVDSIQGGIICFSFMFVIVAALICIFTNFIESFKGNIGFDVLASIINKTQPSVLVNTTIKTPETTAIEFQQYFREILNDHFAKEKIQLSIVIDNLDRIDQTDAMSFWSTLIGFFSHHNDTEDDVINNHVWIILPIDYQALSKIFPEGNAQSFIDKTFSATFRVPPLVMSDWSKFFIENAKTAFSSFRLDDEDNTLQIIRRLLEIKFPSLQLTPRKIKSVLNKISTTYFQVYSLDVDIITCALYCIFDEEFKSEQSIRHIISSNNAISFNIEAIHIMEEVDKWREKIAVIYYLTTMNKALEMLIGEQVFEALKAGRPQEIEQRYIGLEGLPYCIGEECNIKLDALSNEPVILCNISYSLSYLSSKIAIPFKSWAFLRTAFNKISAWRQFNSEHVIEGIKSILLSTANIQIAENLLISINNFSEELLDENDTPKNWFATYIIIIEKMLPAHENNVEQIKIPDLQRRINFNTKVLIECGTNIKLSSPLVHKILSLYTDTIADIANILGSFYANGKIREKHSNIIPVIYGINNNFNFVPVVDSLTRNLSLEENLNDGFYSTLECLDYLNKNTGPAQQSSKNSIMSLHNQGSIFSAFGHALDSGSYERIGQILSCILNHRPNILSEAELAGSSHLVGYKKLVDFLDKPQTISKEDSKILLTCCLSSMSLPTLINIANTAHIFRRLLGHLLSFIITDGETNTLEIQHSDVGVNLQKYNELLDSSIMPFLEYSAAQDDFYNGLRTVNPYNLVPVDLFIKLANSNSSSGKKFRDDLLAHVSTFTAEQWKACLVSVNSLINVISNISPSYNFIIATAAFENALKLYSTEILESAVDINVELSTLWPRLLSNLGTAKLVTFCRDIRDKLINTNRLIGKALYFKFHGNSFFHDGKFSEQADSVFRSTIMPFVKEGTALEQEVLEQHKDEFIKLAKSAYQESTQDLEDWISSQISLSTTQEQLDKMLHWTKYFSFKNLNSSIEKRSSELKEAA